MILFIGAVVYRQQRRSSLIPIAGVPEVTPSPASSGSANDGEAPAKQVASRAAPPPDPRASSERGAKPSAVEPSDDRPPSEAAKRGSYRGGWYRVRNRAPLYEEPNDSSAVITTLKRGTRVWVTRILPGFLAVQSVTGKAPGYISTEDVVAVADTTEFPGNE